LPLRELRTRGLARGSPLGPSKMRRLLEALGGVAVWPPFLSH
jgi:hypothetical protein